MRLTEATLIAIFVALPVQPGVAAAEVDRAAVDAIFADYDRTDSPGCAMGVVEDGELVYARGYGMANLDYGVALSPRSIFRIGSTSKQFTAAVPLLLHQRGELDLDADIRTYLPQLHAYEPPVTVRQLIHHTSGYRDYLTLWRLAGLRDDDWVSDAEALDLLSRQRELNFPPGTDHLYSNSGYFLLSQIVAAVTGSSLREVAERQIFTPLGMRRTHFHDDHTEIVPLRATGYAPREEGGYRVSVTHLDMVGDGGIFTSVEDLARWDALFYDESPLGAEGFLDAQQTTAVLPDGEDTGYAFGLIVDEHRGLRKISHGGAFVGYRAEMVRFPDQKLSVACLCNRSDARPWRLAQQVADLYLADHFGDDSDDGEDGSSAAAPAGEPRAEAEPAALAYENSEIAGAYYSEENNTVYRLELDDDGGLVYVAPFARYPLRPIASHLLRLEGARIETTITIVPAEGGRPSLVRRAEGEAESRAMEPVALEAPSPDEVARYAGDYACDELATTVRITADEGDLRFGHVNPHAEPFDAPLRPTFVDTFTGRGMTLDFERRPGEPPHAVRLQYGRVRNLLCTRSETS